MHAGSFLFMHAPEFEGASTTTADSEFVGAQV